MSTARPSAPKATPNGSYNRLIGLLVTLAMILSLLLLTEGVVRVRQWWLYGSLSHLQKVKQYQTELGIAIPEAGYTSRTIQINELGFRGPPLTNPKPLGTLRMAFLGGSTTFCSEASSNATVWPHLVWKQLQANAPHILMDYINGGVSAYTTLDSRINLQKRIAPLQPDIVIIYHATNDMSWEARTVAKEQGLLAQPFTNSWLGNHSLFWFLIEKNLQIYAIQKRTEHLTQFPENFGQSFEKNLTLLIQEAQKMASLVAVITWTQQIRLEHSTEVNQRAAASSQFHMPFLTPEKLLEGYSRYNQVIRRVAHHTGALLIEAENRIPGDAIHFNDAVHFTDAGSRVMAQRVSDGLLTSNRWHEIIANHQDRPNHQPTDKSAP